MSTKSPCLSSLTGLILASGRRVPPEDRGGPFECGQVDIEDREGMLGLDLHCGRYVSLLPCTVTVDPSRLTVAARHVSCGGYVRNRRR